MPTLTLSGGAMVGAKTLWALSFFHPFWFTAPDPAVSYRPSGSATTTYTQVEDRVYRNDSAATFVSDYYWPYTVDITRRGSGTITRSSSNPSVITPDPSDPSKWTYQSAGTATLSLTGPTRTITATVTVGSVNPPGNTVTTFDHYATGSLHRHLIDQVDSRLVGKSRSTAFNIYSTKDEATTTYIRNTSHWSAPVDLTPIVAWNSEFSFNDARKGGILVSPRHVLFCFHYGIGVGTTVRFITPDNQIVTRTIAATANPPGVINGYMLPYPDFQIALLDTDVPSSITFAKVMPTNWLSKLPGSPQGIPIIVRNARNEGGVEEMSTVTSGAGLNMAMIRYQFSTDAQRQALDINGAPVTNTCQIDSGSPQCVIINGGLVVVSVATYWGYGDGTNLAYFHDAMNSMMTSLGGGYQLTDVDLSSFPTY